MIYNDSNKIKFCLFLCFKKVFEKINFFIFFIFNYNFCIFKFF